MTRTFSASRFRDDDSERWDALVAEATNATFLHSRLFLSYHGDRFDDWSATVRDHRDTLVAVFPAAIDPRDGSCVASHPGSTFGGLVAAERLTGAKTIGALAALRKLYAEAGFTRIYYKSVPTIYHRRPSDDDVYALTRLGAQLVRRDLSTAVDLEHRGRRSERRRRGEAKARRAGVEIVHGSSSVSEFWEVLAENLRARHGLRPAHRLDELQLLRSRFPREIEVVTADLDGAVVAGAVLFHTPRVVHAQYIASGERGRETGALDLLLEECIRRAADTGARYFDFGISTENDGRVLNNGLHEFKAEFGGGGVVHDFYELPLYE